MKNFPNNLYLLIFSSLIYFSGCSNNPDSESNLKKAVLPNNFIVRKDIGASLGVNGAKDTNYTDKILVVEGFIGGMKNPFTANRAVFVLGDDSLETCDEISGDSCPTPWDACCEDRRNIVRSTMSVQVIAYEIFKNSNIEIVKNNNPIILELGQIAKDLKVGERNIENDRIKSKFLSI